MNQAHEIFQDGFQRLIAGLPGRQKPVLKISHRLAICSKQLVDFASVSVDGSQLRWRERGLGGRLQCLIKQPDGVGVGVQPSRLPSRAMQIRGGAGLIPGQPQVLRKDLDDLFCAFADRGFEPTRGLRVRPLALRPRQHLVSDVARENVAEGELSLISDAGARPAQDEFLPDERVDSLTRLLHR